MYEIKNTAEDSGPSILAGGEFILPGQKLMLSQSVQLSSPALAPFVIYVSSGNVTVKRDDGSLVSIVAAGSCFGYVVSNLSGITLTSEG